MSASKRKNTKGWNLQTNVKNKPNAQGTLFSGGTDQIPDAKRYPRGYTPERMHEVTNAVQFPKSAGYSHEMQRDHFQRANAIQNVARSTVPAHDLEGLTVKILPTKGVIIGGGRGVYEHENKTAMIVQHASGDQTVIHEIGHHVSEGSKDSYSVGTPKDRGHEEGFADRYADKHFRPDPAAKKKMLDDPRRGLSNYEPSTLQTRDRNGRNRPADFKKGYDAARPMSTRIPNEHDLSGKRVVAGMDEYLKHADANPRLPGL